MGQPLLLEPVNPGVDGMPPKIDKSTFDLYSVSVQFITFMSWHSYSDDLHECSRRISEIMGRSGKQLGSDHNKETWNRGCYANHGL